MELSETDQRDQWIWSAV